MIYSFSRLCNRSRLKLYTIFQFFLLFFSACSSVSDGEHSAFKENAQIRLFLEHVMIREKGLFTLLGSKPMTEFGVNIGTRLSKEEMQEDYEHDVIRSKIMNDSIDNEEDKIDLGTFSDYMDHWSKHPYLNHKKNWLTWSKVQHLYLGKRFLFVVRKHDQENLGLFINIPNTIYILKKFQDDFLKGTGVDFEPEAILSEISDNLSIFWNRVFTNHYLFGLVMGFGEKNAYLYSWYKKHSSSRTVNRSLILTDTVHSKWQFIQNPLTVKDLSPPLFSTFSIYDDQLEQYRQENAKILTFFKKKDFLSGVLEVLRED